MHCQWQVLAQVNKIRINYQLGQLEKIIVKWLMTKLTIPSVFQPERFIFVMALARTRVQHNFQSRLFIEDQLARGVDSRIKPIANGIFFPPRCYYRQTTSAVAPLLSLFTCLVVSFSHSFRRSFFLVIKLLPVSRMSVLLHDWHGISFMQLHFFFGCIFALEWTSTLNAVKLYKHRKNAYIKIKLEIHIK